MTEKARVRCSTAVDARGAALRHTKTAPRCPTSCVAQSARPMATTYPLYATAARDSLKPVWAASGALTARRCVVVATSVAVATSARVAQNAVKPNKQRSYDDSSPCVDRSPERSPPRGGGGTWAAATAAWGAQPSRSAPTLTRGCQVPLLDMPASHAAGGACEGRSNPDLPAEGPSYRSYNPYQNVKPT